MPYITQQARDQIRHGCPPLNAGELNYMFCGLNQTGRPRSEFMEHCRTYVAFKGLSYQTINDILGAFTGALMELERRQQRASPEIWEARKIFYAEVASPYEQAKMEANGDVF